MQHRKLLLTLEKKFTSIINSLPSDSKAETLDESQVKLIQAEKELKQTLSEMQSEKLQLGNSIDLRVQDGYTLLCHAAKKGDVKEIENLLDLGANPNIPTENYDTPLIVATKFNHEQSVRALLLDSRTDPNVINAEGQTALMIAAKEGWSHLVRVLSAHEKIQIDAVGQYGKTALMFAVGANQTTCVHILAIDANADLEIKNDWKSSTHNALMLAIENENEKIIRLLLTAGANVNVLNTRQQTPLDYAIHVKNLVIINLLFDVGCPITHKFFLLDYVKNLAINGHSKVLQGLIYESENQIPEALKCYKQAIAIDNHPTAHRRLGEYYEKNQDFQKAAAAYTIATEQHDFLGPTRLIALTQKILKNNFVKNKEKNVDHCVLIQCNLGLVKIPLFAHLTSEQWSFLATDRIANLGDSASEEERMTFALCAAEKAKLLAKTKEEKIHAAETFNSVWRIFENKVIYNKNTGASEANKEDSFSKTKTKIVSLFHLKHQKTRNNFFNFFAIDREKIVNQISKTKSIEELEKQLFSLQKYHSKSEELKITFVTAISMIEKTGVSKQNNLSNANSG